MATSAAVESFAMCECIEFPPHFGWFFSERTAFLGAGNRHVAAARRIDTFGQTFGERRPKLGACACVVVKENDHYCAQGGAPVGLN
jgi:hypothetical protein